MSFKYFALPNYHNSRIIGKLAGVPILVQDEAFAMIFAGLRGLLRGEKSTGKTQLMRDIANCFFAGSKHGLWEQGRSDYQPKDLFQRLNLSIAKGAVASMPEAKVREDFSRRPDIVFALLDSSSSMLEAMPRGFRLGDTVTNKAFNNQAWQINSKYDIALVTWFMLARRFTEFGIYDADAHFANFSSDTTYVCGLKASLLEALHPQFGGTQINLQKLSKVFSNRNQLIVTISDGEIGNDTEVENRIAESVEQNQNQFFHVQMGGHSNFSRRMKKKGYFVKQVMSEDNLYTFTIDLTEFAFNGEPLIGAEE